ncbi:5-bromo-4-chloroindolyl phosphate hydrolysis family protein [Kurthia sibirica]|uniref:5-bromo-4-chloroindolyl phosphate hydrolase n=1 Tax=Kurthia sibirica TaxID=202750 RepID=A0A2U3AHV2_9BACL|nr:5-bromo-4-chloroindolyl phosphate hydrolysis family protein [Kurthia sibirica]PWI24115.1 5-bromo-4-chloroindolyl phosphate hydrolase [Kurthia sibirica]GEK35309.1 hypothetical protein KSI01_28420 [Kurthia sibirica]
MLHAGHSIMRFIYSLITIPITLLIATLGFGLGFFISSAISILIFIVSNIALKAYQRSKKRRQFSFTRSEYNHIEAQLAEANESLRQFNRMYTKIRSISGIKHLYEMSRLSKRIIAIVQANPPKFYQAEIFFYSHLPSAAELTEKFAFLTRQQVKDTELHIALQRTRDTLEDLLQSMEKDLRQVLASDIEELKVELDVVKISNRRYAGNKED